VSPKEQEIIAKYLESIAKAQPERFMRGFVGVEIKERKDLQAIAATDGKGTIYFTPEPARLLVSALDKLRKSQVLTFEEEQAFATLEHEILHNEAKGFRYLESDGAASNVMEVLNEITARNQYQRHIEELRGETTHKDTVRTKGNGYPMLVQNFDKLLTRLGIVPVPYREIQNMLLEEDYGVFFGKTTTLLEKLSNVPSEKICRLLSRMDEEDFTLLLEEILP
jgi:hypothetical protein